MLRKAMVPLLVAACAMATDLSAQTLTLPTQRPVKGLFGRTAKGEGFDVTVSTFKGYDDDTTGEGLGGLSTESLLDSRASTSGQFDGLDVAAVFTKKTRRVSFGLAERSSVRYYPSLNDLLGIQHSVTGGLSAQINKTQISLTQTVGFAPFYSFSTLPALFDAQPADGPVASDQVLVSRPSTTLTSAGTLMQTMGRATLSLAASTQRTTYTQEDLTAFRADSVMATYLYHLTRDVGVVVAYGLQQGEYAIAPGQTHTYDYRNIQVGIDYDRALSLSRRTKIGFTTGTTAVGEFDGTSSYRVVGDARLSREFGRTWIGTATYRRSVGLIAGFAEPIFTDGLAMGLTGALTPRVTLSANGGYSAGELTATRTQNHNENYTGSAQLQVALTRLLALSGGFSYYRYRFDNTEGLPIGIQPHFDRRSARIGLSLWLPLFR